ncbi:MAG: hypothetical protein M3N19_12325 [Candidatus Eremiobacteraeota bacterium]|nr:hypothetical protein [Candidatus Eremiobacteraeota bacterium]
MLRVDKRNGRWEAIPVELINDSRLEWDTRGIANWLIARPAGWEIRITALPNLLRNQSMGVGRQRLRRVLRELENAGYLTRSRHRLANGRWRWQCAFRPVPRRATIDGLAVGGTPVDGSATGGQPVDIHNTVRNITLKQTRLNTTTEARRGIANSGVELEIELPECLVGRLRAAALALIAECPACARQPVLDEIAAMHAKGKVRSPIGLLRKLINCAKAGTFVANLASSRVREELRSQKTSRSAIDESQQGAPALGPTVTAVAERYLAKLKDEHRQSSDF